MSALSNHLNVIGRNAANMDRMISDLLDVERMGSQKLTLNIRKVEISSLLNECTEQFTPVVASKSFVMTIESCSKSIFANIDHDRILQVLSNLVGNALKFTPNGGAVKLSAQVEGDEIQITVADNGAGIPEDRKAMIFERFSQLKTDDRRGLGLGVWALYFQMDCRGPQRTNIC